MRNKDIGKFRCTRQLTNNFKIQKGAIKMKKEVKIMPYKFEVDYMVGSHYHKVSVDGYVRSSDIYDMERVTGFTMSLS